MSSYIAARIAEFESIPSDRRATLEELAKFVSGRQPANQASPLTFVCTHNSRRSQLSQVWAAAAAAHYDIPQVETFSGGTAATAFNPRAVAALKRAGWKIDKTTDGSNPIYEVSWDDQSPPLKCFSKVYSETPNPRQGFAAIMTCSQADRSCPQVDGAIFRIAVAYEDPKVSDGTAAEAETYDERCAQIAREMLYVFSRVTRG